MIDSAPRILIFATVYNLLNCIPAIILGLILSLRQLPLSQFIIVLPKLLIATFVSCASSNLIKLYILLKTESIALHIFLIFIASLKINVKLQLKSFN